MDGTPTPINDSVTLEDAALDADIEAAIREAEEQPITVLEAVEQLAAALMRISKKTKMSETGIMNLYSYFIQQEERARMEAQQKAIAVEQQARQAADRANLTPTEVITGEEDDDE